MHTPDKTVRGFTLPEVMVVLAISAIVVSLIGTSVRDIARTSTSRQVVTDMQGEGREGIGRLQSELRGASLGSGAGTILASTNAGVEARPAVQIFDNVAGGADWLDVKPGTDVILVASATGRRLEPLATGGFTTAPNQAAVTDPNYDPVATALAVTDVVGFVPGQFVLVGDYKTAGWARVAAVQGVPGAPGSIQLGVAANILPAGKLERGAMIRAAEARLYYVNLRDELVVRELFVPHAPRSVAEMTPLNENVPVGRGATLLARGIENMQVDCQLDGGDLGLLQACPGVLGAGEIVTESLPSGLRAPRLDATTISNLRTVEVSVVARSREPLIDSVGDDPILIGNQAALPPSNAVPGAQYTRRSYRSIVAVRNTSLGRL